MARFSENEAHGLPRPAEELEELAAFYDDHDTSAEMMEDGEWVDPQPRTVVHLSAEVVEALKKHG